MPILSANAPAGLVSLANALADEVAQGRSARAQFGSKDAAFTWTEGLPSIGARYLRTAMVDGSAFDAVIVKPTAVSAGPIAEGAAKPVVTAMDSVEVLIKKYAGLGTFSTEKAVHSDSLATAVAHVIVQSLLIAYDKAVVAALSGDAWGDVSGSTWSKAILQGIAEVVNQGGNPDTILMSATSYAEAVDGSAGAYTLSPENAVQQLFGLRVGLMAGATDEVFVLDSQAVTCVEGPGPFVVVDPFSGLGTNEVRIAAEMFAGVVVNAPGAVAAVSKA